MRQVVIDASVVVKWIFAEDPAEDEADHALALLENVRDGQVSAAQPIHWLVEVAAVVNRLDPANATEVVQLLDAMELPIVNDIAVYARACTLGAAIQHHVFDTLYHAIALVRAETVLVTADARYYQKARRFGGICLLKDFRD